jgi:hypothetical protein
MPTRAALRVINRHLNNTATPQEFDADGQDAIVAAYQVLADAMGASLEVTLDGQVVLYTGHFKADLQGVEDPKPPVEYIDLYCPKKYIEAREPTIEDLESKDYPPAVQLQWKKDAEVEAHYSNLDNQ